MAESLFSFPLLQNGRRKTLSWALPMFRRLGKELFIRLDLWIRSQSHHTLRRYVTSNMHYLLRRKPGWEKFSTVFVLETPEGKWKPSPNTVRLYIANVVG